MKPQESGQQTESRQESRRQSRWQCLALALALATGSFSIQGFASEVSVAEPVDEYDGDAASVRSYGDTAAVSAAISKAMGSRHTRSLSRKHLASLYQSRRNQPLWQSPHSAREAFKVLDSAWAHGLDPEAFAVNDLRRQLPTIQDLPWNGAAAVNKRAKFDIAVSDALLRYAAALRFGSIHPETEAPLRRLSRKQATAFPPAAFSRLINAPRFQGTRDLATAFEAFLPKDRVYMSMRDALDRYRQIAADGGWPRIPQGAEPKLGQVSTRVPALASRLEAEGDLSGASGFTGNVYTHELESAVRRFQDRHGIEVDGRLGKQTVDELNTSIRQRIEQLRVNLERVRWEMWDRPTHYVGVDIAAFEATLVEHGEPVWYTRAIVGRYKRKTPVLESSMTHVVLNPTWTVPPGILAKDMIPAARANPANITRKGLRITDRNGARVSPSQINWSSMSAKRFPYRLWQPAGPRNALGKVKFQFPNRHHVYLHGTPKKSLFEKQTRTFSSGCVRLENAMELANILLTRNASWTQDRISAASKSGRTQSIPLAKRLPVFLYYRTADVAADGTVKFRRDVYRHDKAVLAAIGRSPKQQIVHNTAGGTSG